MRQTQIALRLARHAAGAAFLMAAAGSACGAEPVTQTPGPTATLTLDDLPPQALKRLVEQTASIVLPRHEAMLQDLDNCNAHGLPMPALCFAEGTPNDVVEAFQAALARRHGYGPRFWTPVRWGPTALDPTSSGETGTPTVITYSFVPDGTILPDGVGEGDQPSDLKAVMDDRYGDRAIWLALYAQVFARWSELIGVRYVYEPNDDGAPFPFSPGVAGVRGDVRLSGKGLDGNAGVLAYNYFPDLGDMVLDTSDNILERPADNYLTLRNVLMHEHGHGLGLAHVCPLMRNKLMEPFLSTAYEGPQADDIRGCQFNYGDHFEPNNTAITATDVGALLPDNVAIVGDPGVAKFASSVGISGSNDVDWYRFSLTVNTPVTIRLHPVGYTYDDQPQACGGESGSCCFGGTTAAQSIMDLGMELRSAGLSIITTANSGAAGEDEVIGPITLSAGTPYFLRVFQSSAVNDAQLYTMEISTPSSPAAITLTSPVAEFVAPADGIAITATSTNGTETFVPSSAIAVYSINGGPPQTVPLTIAGPDQYTATIPVSTCGDRVEYYLEGKTGRDTIVRSPLDAPALMYRSDVVSATPTILFADSFDTDMGWVATHDDLPPDAPPGSVFDGEWERTVGDPAVPPDPPPTPFKGHGGRLDPTYDYDGSGHCAVTANRYGNSDVDWGAAYFTSPNIDVTGFPVLYLSFARFFRNDPDNGDRLVVEVSPDNGTSWAQIDTTRDDVRGWIKRRVRISDFIPGTSHVRVRVWTSDLPNNSTVEAGLDNVVLEGHNCDFSGCPCPADADGSGGTPDLTDITVFFQHWLAGDPQGDSDCSGGTPDLTDITVFFEAWLAGGC